MSHYDEMYNCDGDVIPQTSRLKRENEMLRRHISDLEKNDSNDITHELPADVLAKLNLIHGDVRLLKS